MSFLEHLDELRQRLIKSLLAVLVGFVIAMVFIDPIFDFVMAPLQAILPAGGKLIYTEPTEAFMLYMKMGALVGLDAGPAGGAVAGLGVHRARASTPTRSASRSRS